MARRLSAADGDYLETTDAGIFISAVPLTMACWFRPRDVTQFHPLMNCSDLDPGGSADSFVLSASGTAAGDPIRATTVAAGSSAAASTTAGFLAEEWQHAMFFSGSITSRFAVLNGTFSSQNTTSRTPSGISRLWVGRYQDGATNVYADIDICEVAIWNISLTVADALRLSLGCFADTVRPDAMLGYWPMDERDLGGACINRAPKAAGRGNLIPMTAGAMRRAA